MLFRRLRSRHARHVAIIRMNGAERAGCFTGLRELKILRRRLWF
jgi:hypothetical protein